MLPAPPPGEVEVSVVLASIGPYRILSGLGRGANGEVFLAEDTRLGRKVAVKTLANAPDEAADARRWVLREARAAARLNHPNIASVYDVLDSPSGAHIVMEYVDGDTLAARVRRGPLPPAEVVDEDYPVWLTTGRVVSQYLSGTQTRRIGPLVAQYPEPLCEMHPWLAARLGVRTGDLVRVTSRRGAMTLPAAVVETIRPDTVFIPYHWPGAQAANQLTQRALDPLSKIPEYKVSAVRVERVGAGAPPTDARDLNLTS